MKRARPCGFTLVEVLVALVLLALAGGIAYSGLGAVVDARTRLGEEARKWRAVSDAFSVLEQALRGARQGAGDPTALEIVRGVPAERIGYRWRAGRLEQLSSADPRPVALLAGVSAMELRFLDRGTRQWLAQWRAPALPAAIELTLRLDSGETLQRLFALP